MKYVWKAAWAGPEAIKAKWANDQGNQYQLVAKANAWLTQWLIQSKHDNIHLVQTLYYYLGKIDCEAASCNLIESECQDFQEWISRLDWNHTGIGDQYQTPNAIAFGSSTIHTPYYLTLIVQGFWM